MFMSNPKSLNVPELSKFKSFLEELQSLLDAGQCDAWFEAEGFDLSGGNFDADLMFKAAYPDLHESKTTIVKSDVLEMMESITACIVTPAIWSPAFTGQSNLSVRYWHHLEECIDYLESEIYECNHDVWYMCWNFVYVVYNQAQRRCLVLFGGASD
jgi:hypothetical protein